MPRGGGKPPARGGPYRSGARRARNGERRRRCAVAARRAGDAGRRRRSRRSRSVGAGVRRTRAPIQSHGFRGGGGNRAHGRGLDPTRSSMRTNRVSPYRATGPTPGRRYRWKRREEFVIRRCREAWRPRRQALRECGLARTGLRDSDRRAFVTTVRPVMATVPVNRAALRRSRTARRRGGTARFESGRSGSPEAVCAPDST